MNTQDKALFVRLATNDGKNLSPLHQILIGSILADGLPPPTERAVQEMNLLFADVMKGRYVLAASQVTPERPTADDVLDDWETTVRERQAMTFDDSDLVC